MSGLRCGRLRCLINKATPLATYPPRDMVGVFFLLLLVLTQGFIVGTGACMNVGTSSSVVFSSPNGFTIRLISTSSIRSVVIWALLISHLFDVALWFSVQFMHHGRLSLCLHSNLWCSPPQLGQVGLVLLQAPLAWKFWQ